MEFSEATKLGKWKEKYFQETVSDFPFLFSSSSVDQLESQETVYLSFIPPPSAG